MTAVPFDTLRLARKLEAAGFNAQQAGDTAEALAEALSDQVASKADISELRAEVSQLATKADLAELRTEFSQLRAELKSESSELRAELKTESSELRVELTTEFSELRAEVRADISILKAEVALLKWLIGGVGFGVLLLILRSFWPH